MFTAIHNLTAPLRPEELDDYLSRGWRPTGQAIYTAHYLRTEADELHGCIQIRLPLGGFTFKKRHRKLLRRNARRFRVTYGRAAAPDAATLAVNARYMALHADRSREDLEVHVTGEYGYRVLDTQQVRVYDGDKLVAFSYFDLGRRTAYAKAGIYDPAYADASLGVYTMLLEIAWLQQRGVAYYHPGYVSPTYPAFDYKLRFGSVEYYRIDSGTWAAFDPAHPVDPYAVVEAKLDRLRQYLNGLEVVARVLEYPSYTARYHARSAELDMLDAALVLYLGKIAGGTDLVAVYDPVRAHYALLEVRDSGLRDTRLRQNGSGRYPRLLVPVMVDWVVACATSPAGLARALARRLLVTTAEK